MENKLSEFGLGKMSRSLLGKKGGVAGNVNTGQEKEGMQYNRLEKRLGMRS